ncbi:MAG: efflux RND transporter permease subunit, partial [Acholeplasmataceae bacterium]|nr:efflux RND transporter permease subunit [Acholeplasmataceae bacterium]
IVLQVNLNQVELTTYGLSNQQVLEIIEAQNVGGLIGVALDSGELRMLYLGDKPASLLEIKTLPIAYVGGEIITLEDLAVENGIQYINSATESYSKINGVQGIQISFQKQSDVGITEVSQNIINRLDEIVGNEAYDANYIILLDQGEYIVQAINSVLLNIIIGGLLAIMILFVFLRDIKPTIIVGLAIPISVIAAFMLMYFSNVSLNLVSMGGLALGIGMLVDNAIVVIENIFRMINEGASKHDAAIQGSKQVAGAITSSTLTTIAVFVPIFFIEGMIAEVFISMALTIAFSLGASLIVALTLVPSMSSKFLSDTKQKPQTKTMKGVTSFYKKSVLFAIRHKLMTLIIVLVLLAGSFGLVISKGFIMLPTSDEGNISIDIDVATQTNFSAQSLYADQITAAIMLLDDVESVSASIGGGGAFGMMAMMRRSASIAFNVTLFENRSDTTEENAVVIREIISEVDISGIPGLSEEQILETNVTTQDSGMALMGASGIQIKVSGYQLETLESIANDITAILGDTEGVKSPDNGINQGQDNIKITVNRDNAMMYGLTTQDVMDNISYLYTSLGGVLGQTQSVTISIEGIDYVLEIPQETLSGIDFSDFGTYLEFIGGIQLFDSSTRAMIESYLETPNSLVYIPNYPFLPTYSNLYSTGMILNPYLHVTGGEIVMNPFSLDSTLASLSLAPLYDENEEDSVTMISPVTGFSTINTDGSNRYLMVTAQVEDGKNVTLVSQEVTKRVNTYLESEAFLQFGDGYFVEFVGENEEILAAMSDLAIAAIVAILLVYMVMAIQFQSLLYPFIILGTIPLAFTGGLIALLVTNSYLSLVSIMGLIILIGIVVNNGIVLIDYINKLREKGKPILEAIIEAGQTRLRPILMTALTTILALASMSLGFGEGAELLQPMAITAIGGLIYATLLTLVVVPTIYALLNRKKIKLEEVGQNNAINEG